MNCDCMVCLGEGSERNHKEFCQNCEVELTGLDTDDEYCNDCVCLHEESENGVCNECGSEVDWVSRKYRETEKD